MSRFLVTGAAGFIGFHTSLTLLERGDEVLGIDNLNDYYDPRLKEDRPRLLPAESPKAAHFSFALHEMTEEQQDDAAASLVMATNG